VPRALDGGQMTKQRTFGDWHKGEKRDSEVFNVSYSYFDPDSGLNDSRTVKVVTCLGEKGAGQRVVRQIKRGRPRAQVTIKRIWRPGESPSGLELPKGTEWIDDETSGKGRTSK
jgi:hypothetical protein